MGNAAYVKMDFGCILGTFDFKETKPSIAQYASKSNKNINAPNVYMNLGIGCKLGDKRYKSGLTLEAGYKFSPVEIAGKTRINHLYISLGVLL